MKKRQIFYVLFYSGILLLIISIVLGFTIDDEIRHINLQDFQRKNGLVGNLRFFSFALFFPLGIMLMLSGGVLLCHKQKSRALFLLIAMLVLTVIMVSWPALVGRTHSPLYFGTGGVIMLCLIVMVVWYWSHYRHHVHHDMQHALDFKALGYFCFALAAWNVCGTLGLPGYGIYPEKMQQAFNQGFVTGQAKVVMIYFILAWFFTLMGMRIAAKASRAA